MKKIKYLIITILMIFYLLPTNVLAAGNISVSTSNLTITKNTSSAFTITANNAAGRLDITSSNPSIASVSTSSIFLDMQSNTITVYGHEEGTTTIKVHASDVTTYDDEDLSGKTYTININVVNPPKKEEKPATNNTNTNTPTNNLSTNNKLKEISIEGHELTKVDDNNYTLTVNNDVTSLNINATPEDDKSKITGLGSHEINVGENNIEVIVTSESGSENKINIKITRKDGYYLEDLYSALNNDKLEEINIIINSDSNITSEILNKIKNKSKKVKFNYFDENKKLIYSWEIDGSKITDTKEFLTSISYISEYTKQISKLSNYANGLHINFKHNGKLPLGTKIKLYVGDKFENDDIVKVYRYNNQENNLTLIQENLKVEEGYIKFSIEHCSEYFVTMSNITQIKIEEQESINIFMIISIIELLIIIAFITIYLIKIKPTSQSNKSIIENNNNDTIPEFNTNQNINYNFNQIDEQPTNEINNQNSSNNNQN